MSTLEPALKALSARIREYGPTISTEEAVKTSVVLPFLQALGYDVFNPAEVIPEFTADAVGKKGEKVDYAIKLGSDIRILIECKALSAKLDTKHLSQLFRYFTVTNAKFAILTNGQVYEFYTDLDEPNKLDKKPFFRFDLLDINSSTLAELTKFDKAAFDVDKILRNAERLKYVSGVKQFLLGQIEDSESDLVRLIATSVYEGRVTAQAREAIGVATKIAFREIIREAVQSRIADAFDPVRAEDEQADPTADAADVVTTQEEVEGMMTIRAIVRGVIGAERVVLRDAKSYCAILLDDNNRKPLARLHFNRKQWYLGLFDGEAEEKVAIGGLTDIYEHSDRLIATAKRHA